MRLLYPLTVTFGEKSGGGKGETASSIVRLKCFTLAALRGNDLHDDEDASDDNDDAKLYVADALLETPWPHYFYMLVCQQNLAQNLLRLHWLTYQAMLGHRVQRRTRPSTTTATTATTMLPNYEYEPVLYNVDSSLTSMYDNCSMFDNWQTLDRVVSRQDYRVSHNDSAATTTTVPVTLRRTNNLYRVRLQTMDQYRYLYEFFRSNACNWQHRFSVPVNLLQDQFRYSLDVYVSNLRFKIARDTLSKSGLMERHVAVLSGDGGSGGAVTGSSMLYRKVLQKLRTNHRAPAEQLCDDPLDMRRWFACGEWCLFDVKTACVSILPFDEFVNCARTLLNLGDFTITDEQLKRFYVTPLDCVPRLVWDIETIALGRGTIPRGITRDQKVSSIALSIERPALDVGRLVIVYVLTPSALFDRKRQIEQLDLQLTDAAPLRVQRYRIHAYNDERTLLLDFLLDMINNVSLLNGFFGVRAHAVHRYTNMTSLLIGYNSIDYDYTFLLNRCLYYDLREFVPSLLILRRYSSLSRSLCNSWTFNESQLCLDVMQFLQARNRQLKSYKLANVLRVYGCAIEKLDFSAVEIRRLYYDTDAATPSPLDFMRDMLRYNVFDCLSLCNLLDRCSFGQHVTVMMRYFFSPLDVVMYKGNSSLLPTLVQLQTMLEKREMAVIRQPLCNNFLYSSMRDSVYRENRQFLAEQYRRDIRLEQSPSSRAILQTDNPYTATLNYHRVLRGFNVESSYNRNDNVFVQLRLDELYDNHTSLSSHNEAELLRVGEKTYIGGMNYADPSHSRYPILADYNSFYPSIIRSYTLDVCKVGMLDLKQILLTVPIVFLDCLLATGVLRLFDYTCVNDLEYTVDLAEHRRLFDNEDWHEAVEYHTFEQILLTSRHAARRFLSLIYSPDPSTIDTIATKALERRAVWKQKRKLDKTNVVFEFMEMMEKLLANSLYGYMNFSMSAIFSRATAAAVTLLCRNAFCRTRRIIESRDLLTTTLLDPDLYRFKVIYIDTDGCIFVLTRLDGRRSSSSSNNSAAVPWFRLYADLDPSDTVAVYDRLIDEINRRLNLPHVRLAAEHHNAFAVCVFSRKKYALLLAPHGDVKKTGFESNAAKPIRHVYDLLLRNSMRAFHIYQLVDHERFTVKIRNHRLFFFAIFDHLHDLWRQCRLGTTTYAFQDFCQTRPLNPKANRGDMSLFIDRVLYEFCYSAGERVSILKILDASVAVDPATQILYPQRGKFVLLEELDGLELDSGLVLPNFQFFLGCYTRYFYQCLEGQQTLRDSVAATREPVEPGYHLSSFNAIVKYCWACWLFCRVYMDHRPQIRGVYWSKSTTNTTVKQQQQQQQRSIDTSVKLPDYLPRNFFVDKQCLPQDNPFYANLFCQQQQQSDQHDLNAKRSFLQSEQCISIQAYE